jgi:hypothetical protein
MPALQVRGLVSVAPCDGSDRRTLAVDIIDDFYVI